MPSHQNQDVNQEEPEAARADGSTRKRGWFSWWWVWIPVIIVVILWVAGWSFGNYGGPWSPKPRSVQPQITDPASISERGAAPAYLEC